MRVRCWLGCCSSKCYCTTNLQDVGKKEGRKKEEEKNFFRLPPIGRGRELESCNDCGERERERERTQPTLINFLLISDAEFLVNNPRLSMQISAKRGRNVYATCTCSDRASTLRATVAGWEGERDSSTNVSTVRCCCVLTICQMMFIFLTSFLLKLFFFFLLLEKEKVENEILFFSDFCLPLPNEQLAALFVSHTSSMYPTRHASLHISQISNLI